MIKPTIYCGTYQRIPDGEILEGPLVRYEGKEQDMMIGQPTQVQSVNDFKCGNCQLPHLWSESCESAYHRLSVCAKPAEGNAIHSASDVIERMMEASDTMWSGYDDAIPDLQGCKREAMTAAAKVLMDEALGPVMDEEWCGINVFEDSEFAGYLTKFLAIRRVRILPQSKPDPAIQAAAQYLGTHAPWVEMNDATLAGLVAAVKGIPVPEREL